MIKGLNALPENFDAQNRGRPDAWCKGVSTSRAISDYNASNFAMPALEKTSCSLQCSVATRHGRLGFSSSSIAQRQVPRGLFDLNCFASLEDARSTIGRWRTHYNCARRHRPLGENHPRLLLVTLPEMLNFPHSDRLEGYGYIRLHRAVGYKADHPGQ